MLVLSVPFDLGGASIPIRKSHGRPRRSPKVPAVDIAIDGACCKHVRVMGREVDVCNGAGMGMQSMLDGRVGIVQIQVPDERLLV